MCSTECIGNRSLWAFTSSLYGTHSIVFELETEKLVPLLGRLCHQLANKLLTTKGISPLGLMLTSSPPTSQKTAGCLDQTRSPSAPISVFCRSASHQARPHLLDQRRHCWFIGLEACLAGDLRPRPWTRQTLQRQDRRQMQQKKSALIQGIGP